MSWWLYVLVSARGDRTYVGVSTDAERRLSQHNGEVRGGAKATRAGRPWRLAAVTGPFGGRGEAQVAEHELRRRRRQGARVPLSANVRAQPPGTARRSRARRGAHARTSGARLRGPRTSAG
ncbi:MAG: GIY-YIG nuclease family protein [Candidatus Eiseniibacteriota bacterium]